jgi:protoheme IX farnesyltransferase
VRPHTQTEAAELKVTGSSAADYFELTKPGITLFVAFSAVVGFVLASEGGVDLLALGNTIVATVLIAGGAATLNQFVERREDARMRRTEGRPLPAGRLLPGQAYVFGLTVSAAGLVYMGLMVNWPASIVGAVTSAIYLFLYTPLKQRTTLNTAVGAVAGALPPVGGWAAAQGALPKEAWVLFAIVFFWQIPHFFAIAWIYRDDYESGGFRMVPVQDASGGRTARYIAVCSLALLAFSLEPYRAMGSGVAYLIVAAVVGLGLCFCSLGFVRCRSTHSARRLLRATLVYLPVLWFALLLDRLVAS